MKFETAGIKLKKKTQKGKEINRIKITFELNTGIKSSKTPKSD